MRHRFPRTPPAGRARPCTHRWYSGHPWSDRREGIDPLPVAAFADQLPEDISGEERDVCGTLREAAHQIWIPLRSEWDVNPHAISLAHELGRQIAAHSIQHLKLEATGRNLVLLGESLRLFDDCFVVRRDAGIIPILHESMHAPNVTRVHILLVGICDGLRLLVRPLADPYARLGQVRVLDDRKSAVEITLEHDPNVFAIGWIEPLLEHIQGSLGVFTRLHIDAHECPVLARALENLVHGRDAQILRDVEAHRSQLDGDVGVQFSLVDPVQHVDVRLACRPRLSLVVYALAKQIERRRDSRRVETTHRGKGGLERLARNESVGKTLGEFVVADEPEYLLLP